MPSSLIETKDIQRSSSITKDKRSYTVVFRSRSNLKNQDQYTISAETSLAIGVDIGTSYGTDTAAKCSSISASLTENTTEGCTYDITYVFETIAPNEPDPSINPLSRPAIESWDSDNEIVAISYDADGNWIKNTAGDPPLETIEAPFARPTLTITRNEATWSPITILGFVNRVNSDVFKGSAAGTCLCKRISAAPLQSEDFQGATVNYYPITYEFQFAFDGSKWEQRLLSQGLRELDSNGNLADIVINGVPTTQPVALDAGGQFVGASGTPAYTDYKIYQTTSFSGLSL